MALADQLAQGVQFAPPQDPFAQYAKMQQLQAGQTQNALAQYQLGAAQRADEVNTNFLRGIQSAGTDENAIQQAYLRAGKMKEYQDLLKSQAEAAKLRGETTNLGYTGQEIQSRTATDVLGRQLKTAEIAGSVLNGVKDQGTYDQAKRALSHLAPDAIKDYPDSYDPKFIASEMAMGQTLTQKLNDQVAARNAATAERVAATGEAHIPIFQQQANAATSQANTARAHLGLSAITADPFNLTGAQTAFPLGIGGGTGLKAGGLAVTPNALVAPAAPATPVSTGTTPKGEATVIGTKPVPLSVAINQGAKGTDLLAAMPAPLAAQVAAITDHRAAPPSRNTARADQLMQLVNLVDPTYDATSYKTKQGIEIAFTSGRPGTLLKSLNVVQDHLATFADTAKELGNSELPFVNAMGNKIAQWTGQAAPTNFAAVKTVVADELTKAILGTAGALGDRKTMQDEVNSSSSPTQLAGVIGKWQKLISGQVNGLSDQYKSGGGSNSAVLSLFGKASAAANAPAAATKSGATVSNW